MEKSPVGMAHHVCPVCCVEHDPVVLIDTRLKSTLTSKEFAGWKMCPEHQKLRDDGYTALIEVTNQPTGLADADRTGRLAHVKNDAWTNIFNSPLPTNGIGFAEVGIFDMLNQKLEDANIMALAEQNGH